MCSCHSILECCVTFSGVKLSIRLFVLFLSVLNKGLYTDKKLDSLIGMELKSQMLDSREDILRTNK